MPRRGGESTLQGKSEVWQLIDSSDGDTQQLSLSASLLGSHRRGTSHNVAHQQSSEICAGPPSGKPDFGTGGEEADTPFRSSSSIGP